jgi:hypothetical protein
VAAKAASAPTARYRAVCDSGRRTRASYQQSSRRRHARC